MVPGPMGPGPMGRARGPLYGPMGPGWAHGLFILIRSAARLSPEAFNSCIRRARRTEKQSSDAVAKYESKSTSLSSRLDETVVNLTFTKKTQWFYNLFDSHLKCCRKILVKVHLPTCLPVYLPTKSTYQPTN